MPAGYQDHETSRFLRHIPVGDRVFVYHALHGSPMVITPEAHKLLGGVFGHAPSRQRLLAGLSPERGAQLASLLGEFARRRYLVPAGSDERDGLRARLASFQERAGPRLLHSLSLILSDSCNLACPYCIVKKTHWDGESGGALRHMSPATARRALDHYVATLCAHGRNVIDLNLSGGEPLLNLSTLYEVIRYTERLQRERASEIERYVVSINTNGTLVTEEFADTIAGYHVPNVSISLDGLEPEHNRLRPGPYPDGSFGHVVRGIKTLLRRIPELNLSVSTTLRQENFTAVDERFLDFVQELGVNVLRLDPDFLEEIPLSVDEIVSHLLGLRRQILGRGLILSALFEDPFHFLQGDDACYRCASSMGGSMCVRPDGRIYPCQYIGQPIGHLDRFDAIYEEAPYRAMIVDAFKGLIPECQGCAIEGLCRGGCYSARLYDRQAASPAAREKKCEVLRAVFERIVRDELDRVGPDELPLPARRLDPHGHAPEA